MKMTLDYNVVSHYMQLNDILESVPLQCSTVAFENVFLKI